MTRFNLPDITFFSKSPQEIETEAVNNFEQETGIRLGESDPRRAFIKVIAALASQQRTVFNYGLKQNLLTYAAGENLDHMGARINTPRLEAQPSKTVQRFNLSITQQQTIPMGTRVTAGDGVFFATDAAVTVQAGQTFVDADVVCTEPGTIGNGYAIGRLNQLVDPIQWIQSTSNITETSGGSDEEDDESYAERIHLAPESFSTAGPDGAYVYWAKTASTDIIDVNVDSSSPGVVEVRPLLSGGNIPPQTVLDAVTAVLSDKKVRPLTDNVQVLEPEVVSYDLDVTYWIASADTQMEADIQAKVMAAVEAYKLWQKSMLGRDIDPSELIFLIKQAGAKRAAVTMPAFQAILPHQVAKENIVTVTYGGLEVG